MIHEQSEDHWSAGNVKGFSVQRGYTVIMYGVGEITYWLICFAVVALMGALIYLAWWALFADRPRGRRRCPRCWYDMSHAPPPGMTCAECGFVAKRESQFHRTRRRVGLGSAAIALNVAIALFITERSMQRGFQALLPTHVLIWLLPLSDNPGRGILGELVYRAARAELSSSQWRSFMNRCAAGDWWASPVDEAWKQKYGNLIATYRSGFTNDPSIEQTLLTIPPDMRIVSREVWPLGAPVTLAVHVLDWWPLGTECRLKITPHVEGAEPVTVYRSVYDRVPRTPFSLHLAHLDPATTKIAVDVQLERRRVSLDNNGREPKPLSDWELAGTRQFQIALKFEGSIQEFMQPVSNPMMDVAIREVFDNGIIKWEQGESPVRFNIAAPLTFSQMFANTAVGLRVELLRDDVLARRLNMWWMGGLVQGSNNYQARNYGFEIDFEDLSMLQSLSEDERRRWKMRIVGDPLIALRAGKAPRYWAGEAYVPVQLSNRAGGAPSRPWNVETPQADTEEEH